MCLVGKKLHFSRNKFLAHNLGVTALTGAVFLEIKHKELRSHALNLFFSLWTRVEGSHNRTHGACRANRRKPCNAGSNDQHLGRRNFSCSRNLAGEKTAEMIGSLDHGAIAGDVGHGTQGVEFLCTGDPRYSIHCQGGHARVGKEIK